MLLLKGQTYSISQISDIVGYENVSAFSAAFKKHFGVTPSQVIVKDPAKLVQQV
jgi:AraC-like DNA-binding protein